MTLGEIVASAQQDRSVLAIVLAGDGESGELRTYGAIDVSTTLDREGGEFIRINHHLLKGHPRRQAFIEATLSHILPFIESSRQFVVRHLPDAIVILAAEPRDSKHPDITDH